MNNLAYNVYGSATHINEARFSVLSALKFLIPGPRDWRIVVCTTAPEMFAGFPVEVEVIDDATLVAWKGPERFEYRAKIEALRFVMDRHPAATTLLDSDTYFLRSPRELFAKIGPGRSVMHAHEGPFFAAAAHPEYARRFEEEYSDFVVPLDHAPFRTSPREARISNAGVIGIDLADRPLLDRVLALTDAVYRRIPGFWVLEQLAFSEVLRQATDLTEARSIVEHYWGDWIDPYLGVSKRQFVRAQVEALLRKVEGLPFEQTLAIVKRRTIRRFQRPFHLKILARLRPRPG